MKTFYTLNKNLPLSLLLGISLWILPGAKAFSHTGNDTIPETGHVHTCTDASCTHEHAHIYTPENARAALDTLKNRGDVTAEIEITAEGDTITHYRYKAFDFGEIYTSKSAINVQARQEYSKQEASVRQTDLGESADKGSTADITIQSIDVSKSVGQISFDEGVTPSGGKTVTVPLLMAPVASSTPQIALSYNSQMGNSMAGFGWSISGLPSINAVAKSVHYDGQAGPVNLSDPANCVFSLDGTRLVANNNSALSEYHYETAQGYAVIKKVFYGSNGIVAHFEALFPDGSSAVFGFPGNTTMRHTYPVTSMTDMKGYRIDFEYLSSGNMYFVSKIKYGGKTTASHLAEISFEYVTRTDYTTAYISGTAISQNRLLKNIISRNSGTEIRTYTLTHTLSDGINRLTRLDCSSGSASLNPLVFGYDYYPSYMQNGQFEEHLYGFFSQYFSNIPENKMQYIRGRFRKNTLSDGMIVFPGKFSTYGLLDSRKRGNIYAYLYGSTYLSDQTIHIIPSISFISDPISITAESGFQTINAVDINGDGTDEVVKVNFNGISGTKTILKITVYTLTSGTSYTTRTFNIQVEGVVNSDNYFYSPISRSYYFGDFKGDGKIQLLTVSHNKTFLGESRTSYFALVDLNVGSLLSQNSLFSHSPSDGIYVHTFDGNGDGKTELCYASISGYKVYALSGNSFVQQFSSSVIPRSIFTESVFTEKIQFGDINADGKLDIIVPPIYSYQDNVNGLIPVWAPLICDYCGAPYPIVNEYSQRCRKCNEDITDFFESSSMPCNQCYSLLHSCNNGYLPPTSVHDACCPTHGRSVYKSLDLGYVDNGNTWTVYLSTGSGFVSTTQDIVNMEYKDKICVIDMNHDGLSDLVQIRGGQTRLYLNSNGVIQSNSVESPITEQGNYLDLVPANVVNYYNSSNLLCIKDAKIFYYDFTKDESKVHLLTSMTDSYGLVHSNTYSDLASGGNYVQGSVSRYYPYATALFPLNLLGSVRVHTPDYSATYGNMYYTYYGLVIHQQGLGFCGFEKVKTLDYVKNITVEEERNPQMFGVTTKTDSPFKTAYYYYSLNEESNKQANPRMTSFSETDKLTGVYTYASYQYDAYNNPTKITQNIGSGSGITQVTDQTYDNLVTTARYLVGQPLVKTVTNTRGGASWTDKESITYNADRLPATRITYTGTTGSNKTDETRWTYDTNGNITSEKSAPYNVTELLGDTYTYDPSGRYIASVTNALLQTTAYSNYDKYGNGKTITDHKSRITTRNYDEWGQLTSVAYPDGTTETVTTGWGGAGLYTVTKTVTGSPAAVTHYDAPGREIRTGNQRFDGQWQYVDKVYDSKGRLEKISLPFKGSSPSSWNLYSYEDSQRPALPTKLAEEASGRTTTWSYSGLSTTETKNGIATTKTVDASGALVSVADPGGTITYTLRPDGQPSSITAPGSVVTSFGYDAYGRQTSITDPSAGTQTFSDVYTAAGVLTRTVKDANNKTVTSTYDKYGRVTGVNCPEFNTTYTYNTDGLLVNETSTNNTSKVFTYDTYDRPATARENAPDGQWLERIYAYAGGNVASVQYASQSGTLGTESFVYAHGHNTEIKLGTTSIWKLTEENALGQPTKAITGSMNRTYGYTTYGMPTGRTTGTLQSFTYNFDATNGNLTSRTDAKRGITETFGYDYLNRLTNAAGKIIDYSANGNITSIVGVGTMEYTHSGKPYQVSMITPTGDAVPAREQTVTYTSFQRPATLTENGYNAAFTYNAAGDRVKMHLTQGSTAVLTRYYIGGQYEIDAQSNIERLYLGGDAYSAPAVYVKEAGNWKIYYICRDYLGSITHVANANGSLKAEYSYDAWGRLRNPATQVAYTPGSEPALFLGRGYTGHEHLPWFGLINMNARLYDAALGRFLSPDPYVQMPDFSQNFNRYSYCLNNPLIYVDETGEFFWIIPNISWSKSGGLSIGISVIVGIPGVASAQAGIGYNFKGNDFNAYVGVTAAFNTVYASYSTKNGFSVGWSAGLSPQMGFPISSNFTSVGANYNISHNAWSGNVSAWTVDKTGWTFDPSFSAMVFPERTTNLARGQGFKNNNQVFNRFVTNKQYQKALDYFGFEGTYDPSKTRGNPAITDPRTGEIFYGDYPFEGNYDRFAFTAYHEMRHQRNVLSGKYEGVKIDSDVAAGEEWNTYLYSYENQGLYRKHGFDTIERINHYGIQMGIYDHYVGLFAKKWWHFIYKIPRKW